METWPAQAARENAEWCDVVCRSYGCATRFDAETWTSGTRTPAGYPDAVTLLPDPDVGWGGRADRLFKAALLDEETVVLAGAPQGEAFVAGAVLHRSGDVVGVSNVFGDRRSAWAGWLSFAASRFPGTPLVGYELGDDLADARRHGFGAGRPAAGLDPPRLTARRVREGRGYDAAMARKRWSDHTTQQRSLVKL